MNMPTNSVHLQCPAVPTEVSSKEQKEIEIATTSARLLANNKARALEMLLSMTKQLEANTVYRVTNTKEIL